MPQKDQIWFYNAGVDSNKKAGFPGFLLDELYGPVVQLNKPPNPNFIRIKKQLLFAAQSIQVLELTKILRLHKTNLSKNLLLLLE